MKIDRCNDETREIYEVEDSDFYIEVIQDFTDNRFWDVWLCRQGYGIKKLMFGIERKEDFEEIIEANIEDYMMDDDFE